MLIDYFTGVSRSDISEQDLEIFYGLVIRDVRSKSPNAQDQSLTESEKSLLYSNKDIWLYCLTTARKSVEFQLSQHRITMRQKKSQIKLSFSDKSKKEILDYIDQREVWKINAVKFLSLIERQQLYVKMLLNDEI
jgi:hypothetical protein